MAVYLLLSLNCSLLVYSKGFLQTVHCKDLVNSFIKTNLECHRDHCHICLELGLGIPSNCSHRHSDILRKSGLAPTRMKFQAGKNPSSHFGVFVNRWLLSTVLFYFILLCGLLLPTAVDPCLFNPCNNGGRCRTIPQQGRCSTYICECDSCFSGADCNQSKCCLSALFSSVALPW